MCRLPGRNVRNGGRRFSGPGLCLHHDARVTSLHPQRNAGRPGIRCAASRDGCARTRYTGRLRPVALIGHNGPTRASLLFILPVTGPYLVTQTTITPPVPPRRRHPGHSHRAHAVQGKKGQGNGPACQDSLLTRLAIGRPGVHRSSSEPGGGGSVEPEMAATRVSARISRTRCQMNQAINATAPPIIGISNGRVTSLISS